jgi:predicted small secreted protein
MSRSAALIAAFACGVTLAACGGGDGDGSDVDALTGCLEDAGLKVETGEVGEVRL